MTMAMHACVCACACTCACACVCVCVCVCARSLPLIFHERVCDQAVINLQNLHEFALIEYFQLIHFVSGLRYIIFLAAFPHGQYILSFLFNICMVYFHHLYST